MRIAYFHFYFYIYKTYCISQELRQTHFNFVWHQVCILSYIFLYIPIQNLLLTRDSDHIFLSVQQDPENNFFIIIKFSTHPWQRNDKYILTHPNFGYILNTYAVCIYEIVHVFFILCYIADSNPVVTITREPSNTSDEIPACLFEEPVSTNRL